MDDNEEQANPKDSSTKKNSKDSASSEIKTTGGAYVAGDVSTGSSFVGRDNIQIGTLKIPFYLAAIIAICMLGIFAIIAYSPVKQLLPRPLAFPTAAPDETLILIATFHNTAVTNVEAHIKIQRAIAAEVAKTGEKRLRVAVEPTELTADQRPQAAMLGKQYNASVVIWGEDTGVQIIVNFLNLKEPNATASLVTINETQRTQIANPRAYDQFIVDDLPSQLTFLTLFAQGKGYSNQKDYPHAIIDIEAALASLKEKGKLTGVSDAYSHLGWLYQVSESHNLVKSISNYDKAIELDPRNPDNYLNRGNDYEIQKELNKALTDYNKAVELDPQISTAYTNRARIYSKQGVPDKALTDYNKAIELDSQDAYIYFSRGDFYVEQGEADKALADYNKMIDLAPRDPYNYYHRGDFYANQRDISKAIADYNKAIEIAPRNSYAYYRRGILYAQQGEVNKALADYTKAIEVDPQTSYIYTGRGDFYSEQAEVDKALADYTKAIELTPQESYAHYRRGILYADQGEVDKALADYTKAIELDPLFQPTYSERGKLYAKQRKLDKALADYNKAVELDPQDADAYASRGEFYANQKELDKSIIDYNKAIELNLNAKTFHGSTAIYYHEINKKGAIENLRKVSKLYQQQGDTSAQQNALNQIKELQQ